MREISQPTSLVARIAAVLAMVPAGRVTTPSALAAHLATTTPSITGALTELGGNHGVGGVEAAWHRVVAIGGAVGRHARRNEQIARLRSEGVIVSPAGIVQDMPARVVSDFSRPVGSIVSSTPGGNQSGGPRRARGSKDRPLSSV